MPRAGPESRTTVAVHGCVGKLTRATGAFSSASCFWEGSLFPAVAQHRSASHFPIREDPQAMRFHNVYSQRNAQKKNQKKTFDLDPLNTHLFVYQARFMSHCNSTEHHGPPAESFNGDRADGGFAALAFSAKLCTDGVCRTEQWLMGTSVIQKML